MNGVLWRSEPPCSQQHLEQEAVDVTVIKHQRRVLKASLFCTGLKRHKRS